MGGALGGSRDSDMRFINDFFANNDDLPRQVWGLNAGGHPRRPKLKKARATLIPFDIEAPTLPFPPTAMVVLHLLPVRCLVHVSSGLDPSSGQLSAPLQTQQFDLPANEAQQSNVELAVLPLDVPEPFSLVVELQSVTAEETQLLASFKRTGDVLSLEHKVLMRKGQPYTMQPIFNETSVYADGGTGEECQGLCCVCWARPANSLSLPCRHLVLCFVCARQLQRSLSACPICRKSVHKFIRIDKA